MDKGKKTVVNYRYFIVKKKLKNLPCNRGLARLIILYSNNGILCSRLNITCGKLFIELLKSWLIYLVLSEKKQANNMLVYY